MSVARGRSAMGRGAAALGALLAAGMLATATSPVGARADTEPRSLDLDAVVRPAADLYPGGAGAAQFTVGNPNPFPVRLLTLSFGPVHSSAPAACPPAMLRTHRVRLRGVVPAGAAAVTERAPRAFRLSRSAPNGCQGVTFTASATVVAAIPDGDDSSGGAGATAGGTGGGAGATAGGGTGGGAGATADGANGGGAGATAGGTGGGAGAIAGGGPSGTGGQGAGGSAGPAAAVLPGVLAQTGAPLLRLTAGAAALTLAGWAALRLAVRRRRA